ncbi:hypothetical protein RvY_18602-2 [Ramazzottius varieornatus]|uniref:Carboxylesterase type B domain-containing protein n=1 Tax=Ramazzottius varieornatus TaxID=947166 RepID=A0A1D1W6D6_RAMVA|nr:hypothetical protein RvY_18602-2 [Ramazzottius varieornatus]
MADHKTASMTSIFAFCLSIVVAHQNPLPGMPASWLGPYAVNRTFPPPVRTSKGMVQGEMIRLFDGPGTEWDPNFKKLSVERPYMERLTVVNFLGIPYAEPPTKETNRRFLPPVEKSAWQDTHMALTYRHVCPQAKHFIDVMVNRYEMSEDCLYLNVFTPNITGNPTYPVMVFIHGGGYHWGASQLTPGHMLAASQSVVVVTFNYRLGPLGFLSTGDIHSPGNYGMLDQAMAIEWVKKNIAAFSGDPNRITLFGQSAGAAAVGLHSMSSRSKFNFHQGIQQSGSELAPWAVITHWEHAWNNTKKFGELVGCRQFTSKDLMDCFRAKDFLELADAGYEFKPDIGLFGWAPVVDIPPYRGILEPHWKFLNKAPKRMFELGEVDRAVPFLSGVAEDDGYGFLTSNKEAQKTHDFLITQHIMDDAIASLLKTENYTVNYEAVAESVRFMYTYWPNPGNVTMRRKMFVNMYSDIYYKSPAYRAMNFRARQEAPIYQYVLNYSREASRDPLSKDFTRGFVPHMEDLYFVFGFPYLKLACQVRDPYNLNRCETTILPETYYRKFMEPHQDFGQGDRNMSDYLMQMWGNFAKYGNPTPVRVMNTSWEPYTLARDRYLAINTTNTSYMYDSYGARESGYWTDYLPRSFFPTTMAPWPTESPIEIERRHYMVATWISVTLGLIILAMLIAMCILYARKKDYEDDF